MAPVAAESPRSDPCALRQAVAEAAPSERRGPDRPRSDEDGAAAALQGSSGGDSVAGCGQERRLTEALLWADMVDDDGPLLAAGPACGPPAQLPLRLAAGRGAPACALPPRAGAGARTPLSTKSRPFVSALRPATAAPGTWRAAALAGAGAEREGGRGAAEAQARPGAPGCTTVLLRGLPRSWRREALIDLLDSRGYAGRFNFVYLPVDFETSEGTGYAFVNLTTVAAAECFKGFFDGFSGHPFSASNACSTEWSRLQGLSANIKHYRNSPIMHKLVPDECKPVILAHGVRRPFPKPTVELKEARKHRVRRSEA